ncbi:MAG: hypothetical protein QM673_15895 [Gordonia sp. (in: high G+C Gram-positive bacteria)]
MSPDPAVVSSGVPAATVLAAPRATPAPASGNPDDIDLAELRKELLADHVAAPADQVPAMRQVVAYAKSQGYDVNFVVIPQALRKFTHYRDIATQLQAEVGGTVIVLGPNSLGSASPDFSRLVQEQSTQNLTLSNPPAAARQMLDQLTAPHVDWTIVAVALIAVTAIGAVLARVRAVRQRFGRHPNTRTAASLPI